MQLNPFTYHSPKNSCEAAKLFKQIPNAKIIAGGTFAINLLKHQKRKGLHTPDHIISLKRAKNLKGITANKKVVTIGAMTTLDEIIKSKEINNSCPVLCKVALSIATTQIRNMATIGGNITGRFGWTEFPAALLALEANLTFVDETDKDHVVSIKDFLASNAKADKILKNISINLNEKMCASYQRAAKKSNVDIPLLGLCICIAADKNKIAKASIGINAASGFAKEDKVLRNFLIGKELKNGLEAEALKHLDEKIYAYKDNEYKKAMFRFSLKNALLELIEGA